MSYCKQVVLFITGTGIHPCRNAERSACQYLCLISPVQPYFKCACPERYKLKRDNRTCIKGDNYILIFETL